MADTDYEHWPEDHTYLEGTTKQQDGYDSRNGLNSFTYQQPPPPKPESIKTEVIYVEQPKPKPERKIRYVYVLPKEHPAPPSLKAESVAESEEITHFDKQPEPAAEPKPQQKPASEPRVTYCYTPASPTKSSQKSTYYTYGQPPAEQPPKKITYQYIPAGQGTAAKNENLPWIGRSKAQVDEDNMKIAFNEGAGKERKVAPVDTKQDEVFWVVEMDGTQTLRSPDAIKDMTGSWREDPRFKSWYFVREKGE